MRMTYAKHLAVGGSTFLIGLALYAFAGNLRLPVITPAKLGIVLVVLGVIEVAYALYIKFTNQVSHIE